MLAQVAQWVAGMIAKSFEAVGDLLIG